MGNVVILAKRRRREDYFETISCISLDSESGIIWIWIRGSDFLKFCFAMWDYERITRARLKDPRNERGSNTNSF